MSDLITQLRDYGDQIEGEVPVFSMPPDFASETRPTRPPRPRWQLVAIAIIGLLILLALLFAILANRDTSNDSPTPTSDTPNATTDDDELTDRQESADDQQPTEGDDDNATEAADEPDELDGEEADEPEASEAEAADAAPTQVDGGTAADGLPNLPCGEPGIEDSTTSASADPRGDQKNDFTLMDLFEPSVVELIEVGGPPCHQLRGVYEVGDAGPQTLEVWVTLAGAPNSLAEESYDAERRSLEITKVDRGFIHFAGIVTEHIKLFDYAPIVLPEGVPVEYSTGVTVEEIIHESGPQRAFKTSDDRLRGLAGIAPVPSTPVGLGAVWETKGGEARYEVVDVTNGVVTIAATFGGPTPGSGTIWLQPEDPLKTADEYWTDLSGSGISQRAFIRINERPCLAVETLTVPKPFGGLVRGSDFETTMRRATCGFGDPTAQGELFECVSNDGSETLRREVSWGSLTMHFEVVSGRETFIAFTYETDVRGVPEPGGPPPSALELPNSTRMGMTLDAAEALLGIAPSAPPQSDELTRIVHPDIELRSSGPERRVTRIGVPSIPDCN